MSVRRVLVECAVLSLQDSCVFYPSCKGCFSRIHTDSTGARLSCSKCGYNCARSLLDFRYRLSVRVARGSCLFGVTVFGNCLNQFFGIHASGLQRLVSDKTGPLETLSKSTLLVKAVEECFIGKHFIFGIKVTQSDHEPWVGRSCGSNNMAQLIATQMMLPEAAGLRGCTVLSYFEAVLQKAAEAKLSTTNIFNNAKLQRESLWPIPHNSPTSGFTNDTFCSSDFLPWSLSRSPLDSSLSPTPPWQQSLGLITSSAEQDEMSQDVSNSPVIKKDVQSSSPFKAWLGLSPAVHKTTGLTLHKMDYSTPDLTTSIFECQEEYPLSESLTAFFKDKNTQPSLGPGDHQDIPVVLDGSQAGDVCERQNDSKLASTIEAKESSEDEQCESGVYNYSADLFSNSPRMDMSAETFDKSPFHSVCFPLPTSEGHLHTQPCIQQPLSEICSTPNYQKLEKGERRESFQLNENVDFIPASQSTPAEKENSIQSNLSNKYMRKYTKENSRNQATLCVTPRSRFRKPDKLGYDLRLNSRICKRRSSFGIDNIDDTVPPTPAKLSKAPLKPESPSVCKLSDCAIEENEECDWSRDLFSDSV
ncbi:uncharacterized protein ddias [Eucyclogobius newberryi]|uniref:uncharacterized protein ddias n=1 Tax=Eucyclogobius newberryi TaxID=166745 RepID=UPI003B5B4941